MVTKEDRQRLFELYKKLQVLKWQNNMLIVHPNEKKTMQWIKNTWNLWNTELEKELSELCGKLSTSWETLTIKDEIMDYHG